MQKAEVCHTGLHLDSDKNIYRHSFPDEPVTVSLELQPGADLDEDGPEQSQKDKYHTCVVLNTRFQI